MINVKLLLGSAVSHWFFTFCFCAADRMSGMDFLPEEHNETAITPINNGTFLRFSPILPSTSAAASSLGRQSNLYVYVWLFLGLLAFLLTLLIISLHRLKNIISSSSSIPDCSSEGGSSFTNMEICSISSQRSTISTISAWGRWLRTHAVQTPVFFCFHLCMSTCTSQDLDTRTSYVINRQHKKKCADRMSLNFMHAWSYLLSVSVQTSRALAY